MGMKDMLPLMMMGGQNGGAPMDPLMMTMLMGDDSKMQDMLPLMMMGQQQGGMTGAAAPLDPMMMMTLLEEGKDGMKELLPLMMANSNGGQVDPMMMMLLDENVAGKKAEAEEEVAEAVEA